MRGITISRNSEAARPKLHVTGITQQRGNGRQLLSSFLLTDINDIDDINVLL